MLERYAENARRTIFFARFQATQRGYSEVTPEHILLGFVTGGSPEASEITAGVSAQIQDDLLAYLPQSEKTLPPAAQLTFSAQSQRVLAWAEDEAEKLAHRKVTNYHIVLGLLHAEDGFASQVLRRKGLSVGKLRERMTALEMEAMQPLAISALEPAPTDVMATLETRVLELLHGRDYYGALRLVDAALDDSPDRHMSIRMLVPIACVIATTIGDPALAKHYCELRVACEPNNALALYALADCLARRGETDQARRIARKSYELVSTPRGVRDEGIAELVETRFPGIEQGA